MVYTNDKQLNELNHEKVYKVNDEYAEIKRKRCDE